MDGGIRKTKYKIRPNTRNKEVIRFGIDDSGDSRSGDLSLRLGDLDSRLGNLVCRGGSGGSGNVSYAVNS